MWEKLYKAPFVFITTAFVFGIIFDLNANLSLSPYLISGIGIFLLVLFLLSNSGIRFIVGFVMFAWIGASLSHEIKLNYDSLPEHESSIVAIGQVLEESDKEGWRKHVVSVNHVLVKEVMQTCNSKLLCFVKDENDQMKVGDEILLHFESIPIVNLGNPGEFDAETYWYSKGISQMCFVGAEDYKLLSTGNISGFTKLINSSRAYCQEIIRKYLPKESIGVAESLLIGDKTNLGIEERNSFAVAGAMHLLAVSGLHVGIVLLLLTKLFQLASKWISWKRATIISLALLWFYAFLTGASPSVIRALIMFTMLSVGQLLGRNHSSMNALFFSAFILLLYNPLYILDIGFQLSYLAMLGIFLFYKKIAALLYIRNKYLKLLWEGTAVGLAAQIMTFPVTLFYFHQFPNYFVITNLVLILISGLLLGVGIGFVILGKVPILVKGLAIAFNFLILIVLWTVRFVEDLPFSLAQGFSVSILLLLLIYAFILLLNSGLKKQLVYGLIVLSMGILLFVEYERYESLTKSELVVYHHKVPIISVKSGDHILAFYEGSEKELKTAKRILTDYTKVSPGDVRYFCLSDHSFKIRGHSKIEIKAKSNGYVIQLKNKRLFLKTRTSYNASNEKADVLIDFKNKIQNPEPQMAYIIPF